MYPQRELTLLAARKAVLRQSIARRRAQAVTDVTRVAKPLEWLDRALALWRRIPPLAKLVGMPLGLLIIKRLIFPQRKIKILGPFLRWGTVLFGAMGSKYPLSRVLPLKMGSKIVQK